MSGKKERKDFNATIIGTAKNDPDMIAWDKWSETSEGEECFSGKVYGPTLRHRLWCAFIAGRRASDGG